MAQHSEPMDIDHSVCDFDNKENILHNSNVYSRKTRNEKFDELVTDFSMKLAISKTPNSSPISKNFNREACDNSNVKKNNNLKQGLRRIPLRTISTNQSIGACPNPLMPMDSTRVVDNITLTIDGPEDFKKTLPSSSLSKAYSPEVTPPTKEMKGDNGSPILRGFKSFQKMFRLYTSPIPPDENEKLKPEALSSPVAFSQDTGDAKQHVKDALCKGLTTIENIKSTTKNTVQEDIENLVEEIKKLCIVTENSQSNDTIYDLKPSDAIGRNLSKVEYSFLITKDKDFDKDELTKEFTQDAPIVSLQAKELANPRQTDVLNSKGNDDNDVIVRTINTEDKDTLEKPILHNTDKISEYDTGNKDMPEFDIKNMDMPEFDIENMDMPEFDIENMDKPQFNEIPTRGNDDAGKLFIDAEQFEFFLNQNTYNVAESGKDSLLLKFDPLFEKRLSSEVVMSAIKEKKNKGSISKITVDALSNEAFEIESPLSIPSLEVDECIDEIQADITVTQATSYQQSLTFTTPAIADIDRLLSMGFNSSEMDHVTEVHIQPSAKEIIMSLESQMKALEMFNKEKKIIIEQLSNELIELTKSHKNMINVVKEYERTLVYLISEKEREKERHTEEMFQLMKETNHYRNFSTAMEILFDDLNNKYEQDKQLIFMYKENIEIYMRAINEAQKCCEAMQYKYELVKKHATKELNYGNMEFQKINRAHEAKVYKLKATIQEKENYITTLEEALSQETKVHEKLTKKVNELLHKD